MKALKNDTEATGMRNCHIRDGVALCQYFAWLQKQVTAGEYVDEITGAAQLEEFRKWVFLNNCNYWIDNFGK